MNGDAKLDNVCVNWNVKRIVDASRRNDILDLDSLNDANRLRKVFLQQKIINHHGISLFAFFVRGKGERGGHWMLIVVDNSTINKKVYCVYSFV